MNSRREVRKRELEIEESKEIELLNPFYDTDRNDIQAIDDGLLAIIEKDMQQIGTMFEIWHAYKVLEKPVYIITPLGQHPWLKHITENSGGKSYATWEEFMADLLQKGL